MELTNNADVMSQCCRLGRFAGWAILGLCLAVPASAKIVCCNDDKGQRTCGDPPPQVCTGRVAKEIVNGRIQTREAELSQEQKAEMRQRELKERAANYERRQRTSLLVSYANEGEIEKARVVEINRIKIKRDLLKLKESIAQDQKKIAALKAQAASASTQETRDKLALEATSAETNQRRNEGLIKEIDNEIARTNAYYDDVLKRYRQLATEEGKEKR